MHLSVALEWITVLAILPLNNSKNVKNCSKFVFFHNLIVCFLVCSSMTPMVEDKGGHIGPPRPPTCMNKVAEYFGTIRVKD